ncbi:hypothetical protein T265_05268 [Opisthorchis viverrini]|uniref:C2H2-type domain-containing protein n=1 Tax=Opisthorchis viverrini TaxID=6198 RepID=A0A074ZPP9_OPIVI|nr:hypothetical protein T265_05268 [Opisthorchis viverrini]KER27782.1 hypothetical protein T265_05268 [Opisthorchis viverrini]
MDVSIVSDGRGVTVWNEKKQNYDVDGYSLAITSALRAIGWDVDILVHQPRIIVYQGICLFNPPRPLPDWDSLGSQSATCVCLPLWAICVLTAFLFVVHGAECTFLLSNLTPDTSSATPDRDIHPASFQCAGCFRQCTPRLIWHFRTSTRERLVGLMCEECGMCCKSKAGLVAHHRDHVHESVGRNVVTHLACADCSHFF